MGMFITSKNKYLSNDMKLFGTFSVPLIKIFSFQLGMFTQMSINLGWCDK